MNELQKLDILCRNTMKSAHKYVWTTGIAFIYRKLPQTTNPQNGMDCIKFRFIEFDFRKGLLLLFCIITYINS